MKEYVPIKKLKFVQEFFYKYVYAFVLATLLLLGTSYSLIYFREYRQLGTGTISASALNIIISNTEINATGLYKTNDYSLGMNEYKRTFTVTNNSNVKGKLELYLNNTSGESVPSSYIMYALLINGTVMTVGYSGTSPIYDGMILENETINFEIRLWISEYYTGSESTFTGNISASYQLLPLTFADYLKKTTTVDEELTVTNGNYYYSEDATRNNIYFNCEDIVDTDTCEVWKIVGVEGDRVVITRSADYTNASSRTNSELFNTSININNDYCITSVSTDNKNFYLAKGLIIRSGDGTIDNPYFLHYDTYFDEASWPKVATITYMNNGTTILTQPVYAWNDNYISGYINGSGFLGWSTTNGGTTADYFFGESTSITTNTTLYAVINGTSLNTKIAQLCADSSIDYVSEYTGNSTDTYAGGGSENICYYTGSNAKANANIILGDFCWQIIRTTDSGAIKLLYNGHKVNSTCPEASNDRINDTTGFVGGTTTQKTNMEGEKRYGTSFTYSGTTFTLHDTFTETWSDSTYQNIVGNYTCLDTSFSCTTIYYVGMYQSSTEASTTTYTIGALDHYSQIGTSSYNTWYNSPAMVGYMYNDAPVGNSKNMTVNQQSYISSGHGFGASSTYYYGDKATWNSQTNKYDLTIDDGNGNDITPPTTTLWSSIYNNSAGLYTCKSSTETSCNTVYYIIDNSNNISAAIIMTLTGGETIANKQIAFTYGTGYTKTGNNYTLTNVSTYTDLYTNFYSPTTTLPSSFYVCSNYASQTCSELYGAIPEKNYQGKYIGLKYYRSTENNYIYGNSVTYSNGSYTIDTSPDPTKYQISWDGIVNPSVLSHSHYTCFKNDTNVCGDTVYYVDYGTSANVYLYYLELKDGDTIETALAKMVNHKESPTDPDVNINVHNSPIKGIIDNWYHKNISGKAMENYIDNDVVYCNSRKISSLGGYNSDGGNIDEHLNYNNQTNPDLTCENLTDRFSAGSNNTKAHLTYPVGLLTYRETQLMGYNTYARTGQKWWEMTPLYYLHIYAYSFFVNANDGDSIPPVQAKFGVRPSISLKPNTIITGGTGTYTDPYIIEHVEN